MSQAFIGPLQAAVFTRLSANLDLSSKVTAVYDAPTDGAAFPYIAFGDTRFAAQDSKSSRGGMVQFNIDIWSAKRGQMQAKELMALVDAALHSTPLVVAGCDLIGLRLERSLVREEQSGRSGPRLTRGQLGYRVLLFAQ